MKTILLTFAVLFALTGCGNASGLYVGSLTKTTMRSGYKTLTVVDDMVAVEAVPSRTGKWIIVTGLTRSPVYFDRAGASLNLAPEASDASYSEDQNGVAEVVIKKDFTTGTGTYAPAVLNLDLAATETIDDGEKATYSIKWEFYGSALE